MSIYTTQAQVESILQRSLNASELASIESVIKSVSSFLNNYLGRIWNDVGEDGPSATSRYFDGNGQRELFIDEFSELEKIELLDSDGDVYETIDDDSVYLLYPLNETIKHSIFLRQRKFNHLMGGVKVTAVFSAGDAPDELQIVASELVGKYFSDGKSSNDNFKSESIEGYSYTLMTGSEKDEYLKKTLEKVDHLRRIDL